MDDELIANFTAFTSATPERARQYLQVTDLDLEQAVSLYFENGGADLGGTAAPAAPSSRPPQHEVVNLDSDDEDDAQIPHSRNSVEDDEAMARRMQEEMYGARGGGAGVGGLDEDGEDVRAPMARTTETLMGPNADWRDDPDDMHAAVLEQLRARTRPTTRPGIFNQQRVAGTIWDGNTSPSDRHAALSRATAGASDTSSKTSLLAEMYRPPFEIMSPIARWEDIRDEGKESEKWILVNVQDPNIFDCQVLNRDVWKNTQIQDTVRENFVFKQYAKDDPQAETYVQYYFQAAESQDAYPHIAIVDPRTGEQMKVWSGVPVPKAMELLMQLHEFLDRYSLKANMKNPVATRKAEKRKEMDVDKLSEEEALEIAMRNSLEGGRSGPRDHDPDDLTRHADASAAHSNGTTAAPATATLDTEISSDVPVTALETAPPETQPSPFTLISSTSLHTEPSASADPATTTRIQFRHPGGRVIRRFDVTDPVRRLYEWMKAEPLEGQQGKEFELRFMGRDLLERVDEGIAEAGLKNGSVMVEFV